MYMSDHGCGQLTKAINNSPFDINIAAFAEILPMAVKLGLDTEKIGSVVNSSSGGVMLLNSSFREFSSGTLATATRSMTLTRIW